MSQAPSMPIFWDAYLADTTHLSTEEHGAYLLLLAAMWRRNGWVPDDDKDNARIVGLSKPKWVKFKARLMPFLMFADGQISQKKLLEIWENTQEKIQKNRENGSKGGRPRTSKNNDLKKANGFQDKNPIQTIPEPEPEPDIKRETIVSQKNEPETLPVASKSSKPKTTVSGTRLDPDWFLPSDWGEWALDEGWGRADIQNEANKFRDYWVSKAGAGGRKADWKATWRNWMRNSKAPRLGQNDDPRNINQNPATNRRSGGQIDSMLSGFAGAVAQRRS